MTPSRNEKVKLLAGSLDRASTACFTVGIATPLAGFVYDFADFGTAIAPWRLILGIAAWLAGAFVPHYQAGQVLEGLDGEQ
jgi:hypothetical protein